MKWCISTLSLEDNNGTRIVPGDLKFSYQLIYGINMSKARPAPLKPGEKVKDSGIYTDGSGKRSTLVKGEPNEN